MRHARIICWAGAFALALCGTAFAAKPAPKKPAPKKPVSLPHMQLQAQYAGPLKDTIIQRLRDPADGTVCYVYLPILVQHSRPGQQGLVQYGPNTIGSISCMLPH